MEHNPAHNECLPGYVKYFTELGFNVDVLILKQEINTLFYFQPKTKLNIFYFNDLSQINSRLKHIFSKYEHILVQTTDVPKKRFYGELGFSYSKKVLFVFHYIPNIYKMKWNHLLKQNRAVTLGNYGQRTQINPHYYGEFPLRKKNNIVRFFITASANRKYDYLIRATEMLKNEGLDFEIMVVGRGFWNTPLSNNIKNNYNINLHVSYKKMYEEIDKSDFILLLLDPNDPYDQDYKQYKTSGSVQISYGFLKPMIIHKEFAGSYKITNESALIYETNSQIVDQMRNAIKLTQIQYSEKQKCLKKLSDELHNFSLENLKNMINMDSK